MIIAKVYASIRDIDRKQWNACFPASLENWDYHLAVETAGIDGFQWRYLTLYEGDTLLAACAAFITRYCLDTTVQGRAKRITEALRRVWPSALELTLYALGSPVTEHCQAGLSDQVPDTRRSETLERLLQLAREDADRFGIGLLAVKDAPVANPHWLAACRTAGLLSMRGLPGSALPLPFDSLDGYLASLGKSTRKDLRRTLRSPAPRVEWRHNIDDVLPDVMRLYNATLARSDLQFERLDASYFTAVLQQLQGRAACVLYWLGDKLVAFNLVLLNEHQLIDKFFAHDLHDTREHNLYARSWLVNVQHCIDHGIGLYESGQAGYASKTRYGCRFQPNMLFFRHRNGLINSVLKGIRLIIRPDRHDPALAAAISEPS